MPGNPLDQGHPQFPLSPDFFNDFMVHRCNFFRKKCQKLGQLGWHTPDLLESFGLFSPVSNIVGNVVPPFKKKKKKNCWWLPAIKDVSLESHSWVDAVPMNKPPCMMRISNLPATFDF